MRSDLLEKFEQIPYFTIAGFRQLLGSDRNSQQNAREMLSHWRQAGHLLPLKRGVYMTCRFYELHHSDPDFTPAISAILLPQSYLSLEYIWQRANVLTEVTYPVTAVTIKNTRSFENDLGTLTFRHIKPALYTGFSLESYFGVIFFRASVPKALFDYLYLRPLPRKLRWRDLDLAEDLRLNLDEIDTGSLSANTPVSNDR